MRNLQTSDLNLDPYPNPNHTDPGVNLMSPNPSQIVQRNFEIVQTDSVHATTLRNIKLVFTPDLAQYRDLLFTHHIYIYIYHKVII